jgi:hypothetical protein
MFIRSRLAWPTNLILALCSIALSLFFCEIAIRLFVPVRNIGPSFTKYDPYYGKKLKNNFSCRRITPEFTMHFKTNSLGFRGPEPRFFPYRPVLFLGDSFTMGYGVNDGEEFPSLVRTVLEKHYGPDSLAVVNAGIGNSGNGWWLKFLKAEVMRYKPRLIVLQFTDNDFQDNMEEGLFGLTQNGELSEYRYDLHRRKGWLAQKLIEAIPGFSYSYCVGLLQQVYMSGFWNYNGLSGSKTNRDTAISSYQQRLTYCILKEILEICKNKNIPVMAINVGVKGKQLDAIGDIWQQYEVPFLNIPYKEQRPDLYYKTDGHWNKSGHKFVAEKIVELLFKDERFVSALNTQPK